MSSHPHLYFGSPSAGPRELFSLCLGKLLLQASEDSGKWLFWLDNRTCPQQVLLLRNWPPTFSPRAEAVLLCFPDHAPLSWPPSWWGLLPVWWIASTLAPTWDP